MGENTDKDKINSLVENITKKGYQVQEIETKDKLGDVVVIDEKFRGKPIIEGLFLDLTNFEEYTGDSSDVEDAVHKAIQLRKILKKPHEEKDEWSGPFLLTEIIPVDSGNFVMKNDLKSNEKDKEVHLNNKNESTTSFLLTPMTQVVKIDDLFPVGGVGNKDPMAPKSVMKINPSFPAHIQYMVANVLCSLKDSSKKWAYVVPFPICDIKEKGVDDREEMKDISFRPILAFKDTYVSWLNTFKDSLAEMDPQQAFNRASGVGYVCLDYLLKDEFENEVMKVIEINKERKKNGEKELDLPKPPSLNLSDFTEEEVDRWTSLPVMFNGGMSGIIISGDLSSDVISDHELQTKFNIYRI